jgi:hypothetical protein
VLDRCCDSAATRNFNHLVVEKVLKETHETCCDWTKRTRIKSGYLSIVGDASTVQGDPSAENNFAVHPAGNPGMFGQSAG